MLAEAACSSGYDPAMVPAAPAAIIKIERAIDGIGGVSG